MKRIFSHWEKLNIKYKLFSITTILLLALAMIIYSFLYFLLPSYYHEYKIKLLEENVRSLIDKSVHYDTETLEERLYYMAKDHNLAILLRNSEGKFIYGKNEVLLLKYRRYMLDNSDNEYRVSVLLYVKDSVYPYKLDIIMPLQPIDEATSIIRTLIPFMIIVAILIAVIGAYIYSNTITKPLIDIIESEREEENRRKDFVATISHELKTPITIISGQIEGMIYNIGKYKDRDLYLKKSYECTQELRDLVDEMMEVYRADMVGKDLNLSKVDLSKLLYKLAQRQIFLVDEKNIKMNLEIEENLVVKADRDKITKVINNIINNAIKYSPEGETVTVRLYRKLNSKKYRKNISSKIFLEVQNTGVNIESKYLDEIFNPFYRVEKSRSRKTGGSGLGLYIVKQILESHNFGYNIKNKDNSVLFTIEFKK